MRYFACISYDGTHFFGWQKQDQTTNTVQFHVDDCLSKLLRSTINSIGCGRTDSGVHAKDFYLHFDFDGDIDAEDLIYKANKMLPLTIAMHSVEKVADEAHARFDATERSYVYRIKTIKDVFDKQHFYYKYANKNIDLDAMNKLCALVLSANDFTAFTKTSTDVKTNICTIKRCEWLYNEATQTLEFHITANRFLRGMIRLLVGAMLNVQRGKISIKDFEAALLEQKPLAFQWSVDGGGLMLYGVRY